MNKCRFMLHALAIVVFSFCASLAQAQLSRKDIFPPAASTFPLQTTQLCGSWRTVSSPNVAGDNTLGGIAVISANNIWAVGNSNNAGMRRTLIEHWNGTSWSIVASPSRSVPTNYLIEVDAISGNDIWATGYSRDSSNRSRTLVEHWNGTNWSIIPSPNLSTIPGGGGYAASNELFGIAAISTNDVWAVGQSYDFTTGQTLIEHWDGTGWKMVPSPRPGTYSVLYGVSAISTNDVWATGNYYNQGLQQSLVEHWDGSSWSIVPSPNVGPYLNTFLEISAVATNDVWAVGHHQAVFGVSQVYQTSVLHWDGTSWQVVPSPNINQRNNYLYSVEGISANDAWAVGFYDTGTQLKTLTEHWDGTSWSIVPSPNRTGSVNELFDVAIVSSSNIWAVGESHNGFAYQTFIEQFKCLTQPH